MLKDEQVIGLVNRTTEKMDLLKRFILGMSGYNDICTTLRGRVKGKVGIQI